MLNVVKPPAIPTVRNKRRLVPHKPGLFIEREIIKPIKRHPKMFTVNVAYGNECEICFIKYKDIKYLNNEPIPPPMNTAK